MTLPRLLLCTSNPHKASELQQMLRDVAVVCTPGELGLHVDVDEDQQTFEGNAAKKAQAGADASGLPTLADDSGLCVDALGGQPGVHSARYAQRAGCGSGDAANNMLLVERLANVTPAARTARFVSAVAVAAPRQAMQVFVGQVEGRIVSEPRGDGGFGYDPYFELPNGQTMAELAPAAKNQVSHRGHALKLALPALSAMLGGPREGR